MNPTALREWQELSALYEQTDELDDAALASWLAHLQEQSHPLLDRLQSMLAARSHLKTSQFMSEPPRLHSPPPSGSTWSPGSRIGPYCLLRPLGSGGMAEVWLAARNDGAFKREVAIKLLYVHASSVQRDSFVQRFQRERDILASLNHAHIAGLLDAGVTSSGQPWLALQYVEGEPLTTWCDRTQLDLAGRVRLFLQVLQAVQHAHANLVIHRDLKPANILVTPQGQVQLLDFGIAKLLDADGASLGATELTRVAGQPLTPQYASPEQMRALPLSTASDVYSLGVVLYELLSGERPYELKLESAAQLEQAILEIDPRVPSRRNLSPARAQARNTSVKTLRKALANDLDAIVLKAMSKQPERRYGSVEALRMDLEHWLDGKPVQAKTPSTSYWLRKFVARHRWSVGLGAGAVLTLIAVASIAVVLGLQAREESARAMAARDFLIDMFRQADPDLSHGVEITARQLLDQGQKTIVATLNSQPLLQAELLRGLADAQANLADYAKADQTLGEAVKRFMQLGQRREAAIALAQQADTVQTMGDNGRAQDLLMQAVARYPQYASDAEFVAQYESVQGSIAYSRGDLAKARVLLASTLAHASKAYGDADVRTVPTIRLLAEVEAQAGAPQGAIQRLDKLLADVNRIKGLQAWDLIAIQMTRAGLENTAGLFRLAAEHFEIAAKQCEKELNPDSETCTTLRSRQIRVLLVQGYRERALGLLPSLSTQLGADESPLRQAEALLLLSRVLALNGKQNERPELWARMRALGDSGPEVKLPQYVKLWALLVPAESLLQAGQPEAAQALFQRVQSRFEAGDRVDRSLFGRMRLYQGLNAQALGQHGAALSLLQAATAEYAQLLGADHPLALLVSVHQARSLWATQQTPQALVLLDHALPLLKEALGAQTPTFVKLQALRDDLAKSPRMDSRMTRKVDFFL
jgi:serine/threonine-protein kinase